MLGSGSAPSQIEMRSVRVDARSPPELKYNLEDATASSVKVTGLAQKFGQLRPLIRIWRMSKISIGPICDLWANPVTFALHVALPVFAGFVFV